MGANRARTRSSSQAALVDLTDVVSSEEDVDASVYDSDDSYDMEGLDGALDDLMAEDQAGLDEGRGGGEKEKGGVYSHETLRAEDVYREMMGMVEEVAKVVNVPQDDVLRLLSRYEWDTAKFQEGFFADFEDNMETVCSQRGEGEVAGAGKCLVCFEEFPREELFDCGCAHGFCKECWGGYISSKVEDASTCLRIDCPQPDCSRLVKGSLMAKIAAPEHLKKIKMASIANFADKMGYICVCPGVDCTRYIKVPEHEKGVLVKDVRCSWCHTDFCFDCLGEAHRPISCELVHQWDLKNTTDRANMDWIVSHTKPCPSCNRPIEKNKGCMHMHCTRCGFHFCWLCMGDWNKHGESTGGYYNCTLFEKQKKEQDPNEKKREAAKKSLNRHLQFFERWSEHDRAMKILIKAKDEWENVDKASLSTARHIPAGALQFVSEAWDVVNHCRRVLKWTYVAAYFAFATDSKEDKEICSSLISAKVSAKKRAEYKAFFDFSNQEAEISLERLSHKVETELLEFIPEKAKKLKKRKSDSSAAGSVEPEKDFDVFRNEVIGLSRVTKVAFEKMTQFLENGLDKSIQAFNTGT